jgi:selenocysteine lyase/cysteine desulfurase
MNKRDFIKNTFIVGAGLITGINSANNQNSNSLLSYNNEWEKIRNDYDLPENYINLENGYYCIQPKPILLAYQQNINLVNKQGSFYMRTVQFENKKKSVIALAELAGCSQEELIITRNTTESLNLIISGYKWQIGDEAIFAVQDYGAMQDMFKQVALRNGVKNVIVSIPNQPKSDEEIVGIYKQAITPKTKLLMVSHVINITGQVLPVKKIVEMAHQHNVKVLVDGAHAFAHIQYSIKELGCDYYGTSLHKWLSCPLGAGFLFVKKEIINSVWPLFAEHESVKNIDIAYLNHTGTIPVHTDLTIVDAVKYYKTIGLKNKYERLLFLRNYWFDKIKANPNIIINSPLDDNRACAIANVGIVGLSPAELAKILFEKYKIYTVAIDTKTVKGVRITPNVYTTTNELDLLVNALTQIAKK